MMMSNMTSKFGNTPLTMKVLEKLNKLSNGENLSFSPVGLCVALEMLKRGMIQDCPAHEALEDLLGHTDSCIPECRTEEFTLERGTCLWVDKAKGVVRDDYINIIETEFDASGINRDFKEAESVKREIGQWVSERTHETIKSLDLRLSTEDFMVLLNVIYMKAKWEYPFDDSDTDIRPFKNIDGSISKVEMMHQTYRHAAYEETKDYKSISLPYADGKHCMVIVLPRKQNRFDEVIASKEWICPSGTTGKVVLSLPKFKFDVKVEMKEMLIELGLGEMLDRDDSFPKISDQPISLSQFIQQCTIDVDEDGTEAAAVTFMECALGCLPPKPLKTYRMNVNRPFGFAVKYDDGDNEKIIFAGVVKWFDNVDDETVNEYTNGYKQ